MSQAPHGGHAAPLSTGFESNASARHANGSGNGYAGAPTPAAPAASWGSSDPAPTTPTWTSQQTQQGAADAPTASVPLVTDDPPAPATPNAPTPPPAANRSPHTNRARAPRRARLQLRHVNPWTVLKFSCVLAIALFFVWLIVIGVLFGVLDGAGVIDKINHAYTTIQGGDSKAPVSAGVVFGGAAIIGVVNIVLFIALSTVGSVVYNLCADLVGGIEITLSER